MYSTIRGGEYKGRGGRDRLHFFCFCWRVQRLSVGAGDTAGQLFKPTPILIYFPTIGIVRHQKPNAPKESHCWCRVGGPVPGGWSQGTPGSVGV